MKGIITFAIALLFIVTSLFAVFNAGRLIQVGFNKALDTGYCEWKLEREECGYNANKAKRDAAEAASILLVTAPMAYVSYRKLRRLV